MIRTRMTELLGCRLPILSGGMGSGLASPRLVAAIARAGAFPVLGTANEPLARIRANIDAVKASVTGPFGVNVLLIPGSYPDASADDVIGVLLEAGVKFVETAGRSPRQHIERLKAAGVRIVHKCSRMRDALSAERAGVDAVALLAYEGAGHISAEYVGQLVQIQLAVAQLKLPVIAAGGFASGQAILGALAMGAEGVLLGTRFVLTEESPMHLETKRALLRASVTDTAVLAAGSGDDVRVFATDAARDMELREKKGELAYAEVKKLFNANKGAALHEGKYHDGTFPVGQAIALIDDLPSVADLVARLEREMLQGRSRVESLFASATA